MLPKFIVRHIVYGALVAAFIAGVLISGDVKASASDREDSAAYTKIGFPTVMTYNLMLLPSGITDWEPDFRARLVGDAEYLNNDDILVLTELFDNSATDEQLFPRLVKHHPYRTPVIGRTSSGWNQTTGGYYGAPLEDGGVAIASKWPIVYRAQHIYGGGCGADYWAAKGFVYAVINFAGTRVHIIGTHLQANDSGCDTGEARQERTAQLSAITSYLARKSIPASEPVIIAGDFNIRSGEGEFARMISRLRASAPRAASSTSASYDPTTNSITKYRDTGGAPAQLDHVMLQTGHALPSRGWMNTTLPYRSSPYRMRDHTFSDYSDHYPVAAGPTVVRDRRVDRPGQWLSNTTVQQP
ncbi:sphingomyelin phosphodiesterase [Streptomyces chartreusis]|uniref:sphingomyelin phosphodiesterase n=1 Tax=Streptomyces chartreusis TaxID=1969 RepID=UPI003804A7F9